AYDIVKRAEAMTTDLNISALEDEDFMLKMMTEVAGTGTYFEAMFSASASLVKSLKAAASEQLIVDYAVATCSMSSIKPFKSTDRQELLRRYPLIESMNNLAQQRIFDRNQMSLRDIIA